MRFFRFEQPTTGSDYEDFWINGNVAATYGMPGVSCSVCGQTSTNIGSVRPHRLPDNVLAGHDLTQRWPIPDADHRALRAEVDSALRSVDPDTPPVSSGDHFPPFQWIVPSRPDGDVFWSMLGTVAVSGRLANALLDLGATGFALVPIDEIRCGTLPASSTPPVPESGEPEDLDVWAKAAPPEGSAFFLLSITATGNAGATLWPGPACTGCERVEIERPKGWDRWEDTIWNGDDAFHFPSTRYVIVTERIVDLFAEIGVANVTFRTLAPGTAVA